MCAYHTLCPLTRPKLFILFFLPLLFFLPFVCLPAFHAVTQSLSEPLSHQHFSLSLCHTVSPTWLCLSWLSLYWHSWVGVVVCVSLACSLTFTLTHVLFAEDELKLSHWRQRVRERKWRRLRETFRKKDEIDEFTVSACRIYEKKNRIEHNRFRPYN